MRLRVKIETKRRKKILPHGNKTNVKVRSVILALVITEQNRMGE